MQLRTLGVTAAADAGRTTLTVVQNIGADVNVNGAWKAGLDLGRGRPTEQQAAPA